MPLAASTLAETLVEGRRDATPPACRYLFHQRASDRAGHQVEEHRHPYWQFEHVHQGRVAITVAGRTFELGPGQGLLIPPGRAHRLAYRTATAYRSIKFQVDAADAAGEDAVALPADPFTAGIAQALDACLPGTADPPPAARTVVAQLLAALLAREVAASWPVLAAGDAVVAQVAHAVARSGGQPLGVARLAKRLGLSAGRLSARFRAATGVPLKRWLDLRRGEEAARLLAFSDHPINAIAELLRFTDAFAFSRFFSRQVGESPRAFRLRVAALRARRLAAADRHAPGGGGPAPA